jgi:hypothetical protein
MSNFVIAQGATTPVYAPTLRDSTGNPQDLTTATGVTFVMEDAFGNQVISAPGTIGTPTNSGVVSFTFSALQSATPGRFNSYWVVTFAGGSTATFPSEGFDLVEIMPAVAALPYGPSMMWCDQGDVINFDQNVAKIQRDLTPYIQAASEWLFDLTGRRWPGVQSVTITPDHQDCTCGYHHEGGPFWGLTGAFWGGWGGLGGYGLGGYAGLTCSPAISLGKGVRAVTQVTIDGVVVAPSTYQLFRTSGLLVRLADPVTNLNPGWPVWYRGDLPLTAVGTFGITFTYGADPPAGGRLAAAQLAAAMATGEVTNLVAPKAGQKGFTTGLWAVDGFVLSSSPHRIMRRARVLSPDVRPSRIVG